MTFRNWRIGIHIQQDSVAIVALLYERGRWALRRWWRIPLPPGLVVQGRIAGTMARQLEMPASSLCIDYAARAANDGWQATAAQRLDIDTLRQLARRLKLRLAAIVPDAAALTSFFPWLTDATQGLVWQGDAQWLWATQVRWGYCPCAEAPSFLHLTSRLNDEQFQLCSSLPLAENSFDCWSVIHRLQPPLPACGDRFAIALGLALGGK